MTLEAVGELPEPQFHAMALHLKRYPPAHASVPQLIAELCALTYNMNKKKETKSLRAEDFLTWRNN